MKPTSLIIKLASIITHYQELQSDGGDPFDQNSIEGLMEDPEVGECFEMLKKNALLPVKRKS
ncbi:MAG: hypothetical protein IH899_02320 [Planctomycetes bacterium]|nr:hypothetical protein [Planctomycetota bacterium]